MSPQTKKLWKNTKARVLPLTVLAMFIVAGVTAVFVISPNNDNVVSAAVVGQFESSKSITLDHNQVSETLTNFPVLINLSSDADLASDCLASGWDIAFFDDSDNQLNHEISFFDDSTGQLIVWVNVTSLSSSVDTTIYMYYNDSDIGSSAENPTGVWDSNYLAVYHMDDTVGSLDDSTSNNHNATAGTNPTDADDHEVSGKIHYGVNYDGNGAAGDCESHDIPDLGQSNANWESSGFTIESWDFHTHSGNAGYYTLFYYYDMNTYIRRDDTNAVSFSVNDDSDVTHAINGKTVADNNWIYNVGVWNPDETNEMSFYCDGVLQGTSSCDDLKVITSSQTRSIAANQAEKWGIDGNMDEVRISKTARNSSWVSTTYNNIMNASDGGFFTLGSGEVASVYTINGLVNGRVSFNGTVGDSVWCNSSGNANEVIEYNMTINATDNVTGLNVFVSDLNASGTYINASNITMYVSSDNSSFGEIGTFTDGGSNLTINATTWVDGTMGTSPFNGTGLTDKTASIYVVFKLTIPAGIGSDIYYSPAIDSCKFYPGYYTT